MKNNKQGFTLVELLIVMGILGVLTAVLSQLFGSIISSKLRNQAVTANAVDSRYLMTRLAYDVSRSDSITVPSPSALVLTINGQNYTYNLLNQVVWLTDAGGTERLTSPGTRVTELNFTKYADLGNEQSVGVGLSLESTIIQPGGVTQSRHLTTTYATR